MHSSTYRHLAKDQQSLLQRLRTYTEQLEHAHYIPFLFTTSEYLLILPLFNPLVIFWNHQHYRRLSQFVPSQSQQWMWWNLLAASIMGFLPIINIVFIRWFQCNTRNLRIVEEHLQEMEDQHFDKLPADLSVEFSKYSVYKRQNSPETPRSAYFTPLGSLASLADSSTVIVEI